MNIIKYSLIFILSALVILVSGCVIFPPPFFLHSHHSDRHRDRNDRKVYINLGKDAHEKHHDKLKKMKIKIFNKKDSLDEKLNRMHEKLEHMHIKIDSLNKELIIINDSALSELDIEINMDKLEEIINSSLKDLDKEIELSINASLAHLNDLEDIDIEDSDMDNENFDIQFEDIEGDKVMIIEYFDEDSQEWKEIEINFHH